MGAVGHRRSGGGVVVIPVCFSGMRAVVSYDGIQVAVAVERRDVSNLRAAFEHGRTPHAATGAAL